jgi:putative ABC transport system permease protein
VLRTLPRLPSESLADSVRTVLTSRFPNHPVAEVRPMSGWIQESLSVPRLYSVLLGGFAVQAVLIACVGLYGLLGHTAAIRRREIGIRIAVGAQPSQVTALLLRRGVGFVLAGCAMGTVGGLLLSDLLRTQLYGVQPNDPHSLAAVVLLFACVAAVSMLIPALRAGRTDPAEVLRTE